MAWRGKAYCLSCVAYIYVALVVDWFLLVSFMQVSKFHFVYMAWRGKVMTAWVALFVSLYLSNTASCVSCGLIMGAPSGAFWGGALGSLQVPLRSLWPSRRAHFGGTVSRGNHNSNE